jgi:hypothetical protein
MASSLVFVMATLSLFGGAAFPSPGQNVQVGIILANNGQSPGGYQVEAQLVNLANGLTEGHFFTAKGGQGTQTATGTVEPGLQQVVILYAPITATAEDIAGYDVSQGLAVEVTLNGVVVATVAKAVFLEIAGTAALEILSVSGVQWSSTGSIGSTMAAAVSVRNPSTEVGQAVLHGVVLVDGIERENFGYPTVTVQPGQTITVPVQTVGPVTNELAGHTAIPSFGLYAPVTGAPIGQVVTGQGLVIPS